jgi:hypothetical protein
VTEGEEAFAAMVAERAYASRGDAVGCAGSLAQAVLQAAHARLAAEGAWVLNEKRMAERAGLAHLRARFARMGGTSDELRATLAAVSAALLDEPA